MADPILIFFLAISAFVLASLWYVFICWRGHRIPNGPFTLSDYTTEHAILANNKRIVMLGDSLTHGTMSHNWLEDLQTEFKEKYAFINAGTNGDLAWNALQKIDQISACRPDIVAIFIGGNDCLASLSPTWAKSFIERKKLPHPPTADWYRENLAEIIVSLKTKTDARLVLFTLTLFGEDLDSLENKRMKVYSQIVLETAEKYQLPAIPIHRSLRSDLTTRQEESGKKPLPATNHADYRRLMRWSLIRYHFMFQSWDKISADRGYMAQTDGVHLNSQAAGVITKSFTEWLKRNDK